MARSAALLAGIALPLAVRAIIGPERGSLAVVIVAAAAGAVVLARLHGRVEGWRVAGYGLAAFILFSVVR